MSTELVKSTFPAMLEKFKPEIARALPRHLSADRMVRIAITAFRRTPKLERCEPRSVFAAVIQASQLGLEPDTLGRSFLIPYGNECQFVPGWKGLVDLVNRSGNATVWTGAVFEGDEFDYALGDRPFVIHKPGLEDDPAKMTHVYAVGRVRNSEWPVIEVWRVGKVWKHRDRYNKVGTRHYSFENQEMYARKIPLLQVLKYMPASAEMTLAMDLEYAAQTGSQNLTVKEVIDGTWAPPIDDEPRSTQDEVLAAKSATGLNKIKERYSNPPAAPTAEAADQAAPSASSEVGQAGAEPVSSAPPPANRDGVGDVQVSMTTAETPSARIGQASPTPVSTGSPIITPNLKEQPPDDPSTEWSRCSKHGDFQGFECPKCNEEPFDAKAATEKVVASAQKIATQPHRKA